MGHAGGAGRSAAGAGAAGVAGLAAQAAGGARGSQAEFEDVDGNVMSREMYEMMARQGLLGMRR